MKIVQCCFSLLLFSIFSLGALQAQTGYASVNEALDAGLKTYVKNVHPKKGCECNDCRHTYKGAFKITKRSSVQGTLRVNATVKVSWKNAYTAGDGVVPVYAEFQKQDGLIVMTKLKWRKGGCMQFETLLQ